MAPQPGNDELERQLEQERADRAREAQQDDANPGDEQPDDAEDDDELEDEPDDDELEDDDEPEAVAVKEPTPEQQARKLGKIVDSFELELRELFGVDEPLTPLSMDGAIGFMFPGMLELLPNEKYRGCRVCNSHGKVLTGSLAEGNQTTDCPKCGGRGYLEKLEGQQPPTDEQTNGNAAADEDAGFGVPAWMGNPNIGAGS